jgi:hypothetical protein
MVSRRRPKPDASASNLPGWAWALRLVYAENVARQKPPDPPVTRGRTDEEQVELAIWLWAMAQPLVGLDEAQAQAYASQFGLSVDTRPLAPDGHIMGEMYSAPHTIAVQYEKGRIGLVAVEGVWPNYWSNDPRVLASEG